MAIDRIGNDSFFAKRRCRSPHRRKGLARKTLETQRLRLRPFRRDDLVAVHLLLYADPEVALCWTGRTRMLDEVRCSFARKVEQPEGCPGWAAIVLNTVEMLIGAIGLQRWQPDEDPSWLIFEHPEDALCAEPSVVKVELAYALGRANWGQGYATEAAAALLAYGFGELGISRVVRAIDSVNTRSIRLAKRLGCRIQRNLPPHPYRYRDTPEGIATLDHDTWRQMVAVPPIRQGRREPQ